MYPKNDISWDLDKYLGAFRFRLSIDGVAQETMKIISVSDVSSESDIVEYKLGPEPFVRKIPGRAKFTELQIERIYQGYDHMYLWRTKIEDGIDDLRKMTIEILAPDLKKVVRKIVLHNCWPVRWKMPDLNASSTNPATETITFACERVTGGITESLSRTTSIKMLTDAKPGIETSRAQVTWALAENDALAKGVDPATLAAELKKKRDKALADAAKKTSGPLDPNTQKWAAPTAGAKTVVNLFDTELKAGTFGKAAKYDGVDKTAAQNGGDGTGPIDPNTEKWDKPKAGADSVVNLFDTEVLEGKMDAGPLSGQGEGQTADTAPTNEGPKSGQGVGSGAEFAKTDDDGKPLDPNTETWAAPEAGEDPTFAKAGGKFGEAAKYDGVDVTAAKNGGDGAGPIGGQGVGAGAEFFKTDDDGKPLDPNTETWAAPKPGEDPTFAKNGGDGTGPIGGQGEGQTADTAASNGGPLDPNSETWGAPAAGLDPTAAKNGGDGTGPIGGQGAGQTADTAASNGGPLDPNSETWGAPAAGLDPTAAKNGGDGSGPIGGQGEAQTADTAASNGGPIDPNSETWAAPTGGIDPTAAKQGGDGKGPIGGRGAQAAVDTAPSNEGPKGGQGEPDSTN